MSTLCCPHCLDVIGKCVCGLENPWEVVKTAETIMNGSKIGVYNLKCVGCDNVRLNVAIMRNFLTPLQEMEQYTDAEGFVCGKLWCPTRHAAYQVGIRKTTSHKCKSCGFNDIQFIRGGPEIQAQPANPDWKAFQESVMGA